MEAPCVIEVNSDFLRFVGSYRGDDDYYKFVRCGEGVPADLEDEYFTRLVGGGDEELSECYQYCDKEDLYFTVWSNSGFWCACGNSLAFLDGDYYEEGTCDVQCADNEDEICGGETSYSLYEILEPNDGTPAPTVQPTCSTGITGNESENGHVCCPLTCWGCGGDRCVGEGGCCEESIQEDGILCSESGTAPCIFIVDEPDDDSEASRMTRLLLLGMVPLYVTGKSQVALGRNEADGHAFLRNNGGRTLQAGDDDYYKFVRCGEGVPADLEDEYFTRLVGGGDEELSECYQYCDKEDLYFTVWSNSGFWCACGNSLAFLDGDYYEEGTCDVQCADNEDEICGGETSYSLYEILEPNGEFNARGGGVGTMQFRRGTSCSCVGGATVDGADAGDGR
eukprot:g15857.t1